MTNIFEMNKIIGLKLNKKYSTLISVSVENSARRLKFLEISILDPKPKFKYLEIKLLCIFLKFSLEVLILDSDI